MKTWFAIAAVAVLWIAYRRRQAAGPSPAQDGSQVDVPTGATIGQIGARIENPQALSDFADAIEASAVPRVIDTFTVGNNYQRLIWSDGRVTVMDGSGNVITDQGYSPLPGLP